MKGTKKEFTKHLKEKNFFVRFYHNFNKFQYNVEEKTIYGIPWCLNRRMLLTEPKENINSFSKYLSSSFVYSDTNEGMDFWFKIESLLCNGKN